MKRLATVAAAALVLLLATGSVAAQTGGPYDLSWWTVDGGGGESKDLGSGYALMGTAGQPDAWTMGDNDYSLAGGFWSNALIRAGNTIYLPLVVRGS